MKKLILAKKRNLVSNFSTSCKEKIPPVFCCVVFFLSTLTWAAEADSLDRLPLPVNELGLEDLGTFSGILGMHYHDMTNREENRPREEFGNAYAYLSFETVEMMGMQLGITGLFQDRFQLHIWGL